MWVWVGGRMGLGVQERGEVTRRRGGGGGVARERADARGRWFAPAAASPPHCFPFSHSASTSLATTSPPLLPIAAAAACAADVARAKLVVGDPSYFPDKVRVVGKVVRAIAIMVSVSGGRKYQPHTKPNPMQ